MDSVSYKTIAANKQTVKKEWLLIDATDLPLGRLAGRLAMLARGKHKTTFTPHVDCGDHVVVINAEKVKLTGLKWDQKVHVSHSGYPGGQKHVPVARVREKRPIRVIEEALKGMIPKNRLGRRLFHNIHVYEGASHPHTAQNPRVITLESLGA